MTRRGSVIGPLILILIGLLFLLRNVWPDIAITHLITQYWPYVLIAWGALRLIEILVWAALSRPLPRNGVSGGEWVLVVFLCIFGSAFHTMRHYDGWFPDGRALRGFVVNMGDSYDFPISPATKPSGKAPRVIIESFRGNARITGADASAVTVSGRKTVRAFQQNDADRANAETPLDLISQADDVIVRTNQDRVQDASRVSDDLEIAVPRGATIEAHGRYGDFEINDIGGSVEIDSDNAGVRVQNIGGNVRVDLRRSDLVRAAGVKGTVELKGHGNDIELQDIAGQVTVNGTYTGQVQLRNVSSPVRYEGSLLQMDLEKLPGQIHAGPGEFTGTKLIGPVRLSGNSADVQISDVTQSLDVNVRRGNLDLRPASGNVLPRVDAHTDSGDIDVALPVNAKFDFRASTDHGEAQNDFGSALKSSEDRDRASIEGAVGSGPQIRVSTRRGNITARKAGADNETIEHIPQPPHPPVAPLKPEEQ